MPVSSLPKISADNLSTWVYEDAYDDLLSKVSNFLQYSYYSDAKVDDDQFAKEFRKYLDLRNDLLSLVDVIHLCKKNIDLIE